MLTEQTQFGGCIRARSDTCADASVITDASGYVQSSVGYETAAAVPDTAEGGPGRLVTAAGVGRRGRVLRQQGVGGVEEDAGERSEAATPASTGDCGRACWDCTSGLADGRAGRSFV